MFWRSKKKSTFSDLSSVLIILAIITCQAREKLIWNNPAITETQHTVPCKKKKKKSMHLEQINEMICVLVADHKHLEYLCTAKRLKSYQAKWSLLLFQLTSTSIIAQGQRLESQRPSLVFQWRQEKNSPVPILPNPFIISAGSHGS